MAESKYAKAYEAIGEFFCAYSALEGELAEAVKAIFRLHEHPAADTIVAALEDFARKARLVRGAVSLAKNADGSETAESWKSAADQTMGDILGLNDDRVLLAHSILTPNEDGSVKIKRLHLPQGRIKERELSWTEADFKKRIETLQTLTGQLRDLKRDLSTFKITPETLWMTLDPYQPHLTRMGSAPVLMSQSEKPK
jgi:hypothetical protein